MNNYIVYTARFYGMLALFLALVLGGCSRCPTGAAYQEMYAYLKEYPKPSQCTLEETEYFLIILVNARHLDYTDNQSFFRTVVKHPSDGSKNGDVGHAWIYLQGCVDGEIVVTEGGHSGELGVNQARYFDGIMNYIQYGYGNPTPEEMQHPRFEPNPVKYLWETLHDGFFQKGSTHTPTYAVKIDLTREQYERIVAFIDPENYDYRNYSVTKSQCSTLVAQVAALADFPIEHEVVMPISRTITIGGDTFVMWEDPYYSSITFSTPDVIERSLMEAVAEGRAEYVLPWYLKCHKKSATWSQSCENMRAFPSRVMRVLYCQ